MSDSFNRNAYMIPKNSIFVTKGVEDMINKILSASCLYFRDIFPLIFIVNNKGRGNIPFSRIQNRYCRFSL